MSWKPHQMTFINAKTHNPEKFQQSVRKGAERGYPLTRTKRTADWFQECTPDELAAFLDSKYGVTHVAAKPETLNDPLSNQTHLAQQ